MQSPALSFVPRIGLDIRLLSSVSLTIDAGYRFDLWGHDRYSVRMTSGPAAGRISRVKYDQMQTFVNIGMKVDFPMRPVSAGQLGSILGCLIGLFGGE